MLHYRLMNARVSLSILSDLISTKSENNVITIEKFDNLLSTSPFNVEDPNERLLFARYLVESTPEKHVIFDY